MAEEHPEQGALALVVVIPFGDGIVSVGHYVIVPSDGSEGVHPPVFAVDDLLGWLVHVEDLQDRVLEVILDVSGAELSELLFPPEWSPDAYSSQRDSRPCVAPFRE